MKGLPYRRKDLRHLGEQRRYGPDATQAAFLLGGIGTGNISVGSRGELRDWEIFNRSSKGQKLPYSFFSIGVRNGDSVDARVLEARLVPPFTQSHGFHPSTTAGLPRFSKSLMWGEYPFCFVDLVDDELLIGISLEAYTPFIPLEPDDSGIPSASFTYNVRNLTNEPLDVTIVGSLLNSVGFTGFDEFGALRKEGLGKNINEYRQEAGLRGLYLWSMKHSKEDILHGSLALATTNLNVTYKRHWLRSGWWDLLREFWDDLSSDALLTDLGYSEPSSDQSTDVGSLGVCDRIEPHGIKQFRFILSWFFPNRVRNWNQRLCSCADGYDTVKNRYATRFDSAWDVASYHINNWKRLDSLTREFHDALFGSTLPSHVIDALSANITALRSNTCFWLEDGTFLGYEGCFDDAGCCSGSCTHVWNYAQTLAYLFPSLERNMRETEFRKESESDGRMSFRSYRAFPGSKSWDAADPASDGQCGSIMRVYREWMISGETGWMIGLWPHVKLSMEYGIKTWDEDEDGVTDGRQHNTYDIQFFGPNPISSIMYLGALKAASRMAEASGDHEAADRYSLLFRKGSRKLEQISWDDDYYVQRLDDVDLYKYQHGTGCLSDQLLGQLNAHLSGLGYLLPPNKVKRAIKAVFENNYLINFEKHDNCQRTFVLNDEAGLLACTWPKGGRPKIPFPYSHEVWTGIEYHVASHLIWEGFLDEGLTLVKSLRDRQDGVRRNPWDECECGHHYARSMSSWGLLLALSGFKCDMSLKKISFKPKINANDFKCFFSTGTSWGTYTQKKVNGKIQRDLKIKYGSLGNIKLV